MKVRNISFTLATALVSALFISDSAAADSRLNLASTSPIVMQGTASTFTPTISGVSENASYDWSQLKYEISQAVGRVTSATVSVWQLSSAPCSGSTSGASGSNRFCTSIVSPTRTIVSAATSYANGSSATARIDANGGSGTLRVRVWLDRNANNQIDPYEPSSAISSLQVLDPRNAKPFFNFQIDPPTLSDQVVRASVTSSAAIAGSNGSSGLVDPTKLSIQINQCKNRDCVALGGSTTWVPHPQVLAYEYISDFALVPNSLYGAQLIYNKSNSEKFVLATKEFDYRSENPSRLETTITAPSGLVLEDNFELSQNSPRQKTYLAEASLSTFVYTATLKDKLENPIVGKQVYIAFDLKDVSSLQNLLANGQQLSASAQDKIFLGRKTDSAGQVKLNISYTNAGWLDRIGIDAIVNGLHSYEIAGGAGEEVVAWDNSRDRVIELSFTKGTSGSESNRFLTVRAQVKDKQGRSASGERVLFGGESPLLVDTPVQVLADGVASSNVRLGRVLEKSGSAMLSAQIVSETGLAEAFAEISWTNYGEAIKGTISPHSSASISSMSILGASIKRASVNGIEMSVPGTTQREGVVFKVNGKVVSALKNKRGLSRTIKLGSSASRFEILVNGLVAAKYIATPRSSRPIQLASLVSG
jgi:hypothetical protein